ncbi:MAG: terminase large subunit [Lachnospiraceae bacterium]|nr:terminase large subunit [Lachnospiraceae bacterium]MCM1239965.1 terminase large subunit [Lachnospiraceae bacterium]
MRRVTYPSSYNPILEYWDRIRSGEIAACDKTRRWYRYLAHLVDSPGEYFYSAKRANHILEFAENYCRPSKGTGARLPVRLELWEKAHLAAVFGFIDKEGRRMCRESLLIVGKKNGKSLLASVVGLYMLVGDGEPGPEVYATATKRDQAKIIWQESRKMVRKSPTLLRRIKPLVSELSSEEYNDGYFRPLASDQDTLDGLDVHCGLMDEIHQWKNGRAMYDIIADGVTARQQPLIYITSTAGTIREDLYDQKYEEAERVINGLEDENGYHDIHFFPFIYELDKRSEWTDEECWYKANPGLGTIKDLDALREKARKALEDHRRIKNLVCKEFNVRETSTESWLTWEQIQNRERFDIRALKPRYGIGGADLSSTTDLTCATLLFMVRGDERIYVEQMYWIPEDLLEKRVREDKVPYDQWRDEGLLRTCPGNKVHYKYVVEWFLEMQNEADLYLFKCGVDDWSAEYFKEDLRNEFGKCVVDSVIQGKKTLSGPMKSLGADLEAKRIVYDDNPILKWCLYNVVVDVDRNDNIQPAKGKQGTRRIDGAASLLDAYVELGNNLEEYLSLI